MLKRELVASSVACAEIHLTSYLHHNHEPIIGRAYEMNLRIESVLLKPNQITFKG